MNIAVSILISAVLVAGGIGTYHVLTVDGRAPVPADGAIELSGRDVTALEDRLGDLENRGPLLQGQAAPAELYDRIKALEARLAALEKQDPARVAVGETVAAETPAAVAAAAGGEAVSLPDGSVSPLTKSQEKRIADLVQESMRSRFRRAGSDRMNRTLERLGLDLTDDQRQQLDTAMNEHFTKVRDIFRSGREAGQSREETMEQMGALNRDLTDKVSSFLNVSDAEAIVQSVTQPPRRPDGGRPGGGPGRRGNR